MGKVAVVYWSGTGNTEEMAKAVLEGAKKGGAEAELFTVSDFGADKMADYSGFLFGSYGWGSGAWMEAWAERTKAAGAKLVSDGVIVENAPDDDGVKACEDLGEAVAKAL